MASLLLKELRAASFCLKLRRHTAGIANSSWAKLAGRPACGPTTGRKTPLYFGFLPRFLTNGNRRNELSLARPSLSAHRSGVPAPRARPAPVVRTHVHVVLYHRIFRTAAILKISQ